MLVSWDWLKEYLPLDMPPETLVKFQSFVAMERSAEAHMKAPAGLAIGREAALRARGSVGTHQAGWIMFQFLLRSYVPDPSVVG